MQTIGSFLDEWASAERAGDTCALAALLTDDFTGVGPLGFVLPKAGWLARHQQGALSYQAFGFDQTQSRVHGDAAVITGRNLARGAYQGNPVPEAVRATLTLVADAGRWRLAAIHMSFIAGTPGAPPVPSAATRAVRSRRADRDGRCPIAAEGG
jgi:ketosteroid isomerase-like protein